MNCSICNTEFKSIENYGSDTNPVCYNCANEKDICDKCGKEVIKINAKKINGNLMCNGCFEIRSNKLNNNGEMIFRFNNKLNIGNVVAFVIFGILGIRSLRYLQYGNDLFAFINISSFFLASITFLIVAIKFYNKILIRLSENSIFILKKEFDLNQINKIDLSNEKRVFFHVDLSDSKRKVLKVSLLMFKPEIKVNLLEELDNVKLPNGEIIRPEKKSL